MHYSLAYMCVNKLFYNSVCFGFWMAVQTQAMSCLPHARACTAKRAREAEVESGEGRVGPGAETEAAPIAS